MSKSIRLANRSLTLYLRRDVHFTNQAEEQRAAESAKKFLADSFSWQHDSLLMAQLQELLGLSETDVSNARWKVQCALETGELVTKPDAPSSGLNGSRDGNDVPRSRSFTLTPSQLFKGAPRLASCVREYVPCALPRLPADDFFEIMAAKPGEVLPDGRIATAFTPDVLDDSELEALRQRVFGNTDADDGDSLLGSSVGDADGSDAGSCLGDAQPFEYVPNTPDGEVFDLAKTPNDGDPGTWYTNPGSGQMRLYGNSGQPAVDFDFDHDHGQGVPHAHNWGIDRSQGKIRADPAFRFQSFHKASE
ncbi:hypothetical protein BSFA1_47700 [Burkholderia sp. SFA1]|uniref:hypothetical protein n=1 Tax=Caballeronia sp. CLC5 TaxID=2906764 RepID=UPI001F3415E9|nr:hypothetical protein [Caballeronia sp. CLC5]MCE4574258.1 hypothetical protein [Caballeronia sp. CLC5]BBP99641.1 hypothetical protein BSFA1_47700 [Burkholderia sp. SFA1]